MNPEAQPGQPGGPTVASYTTVNVGSEPPRDYIIWSLLTFAYSNPCCLGLVALINSVRARDRKMVGDLEGSQRFATTARKFNIVATALGSVMFFIFFIIIIVSASNASSAGGSYQHAG